MTLYRSIWLAMCGLVAAAGCAAATVTLGPLAIALWFVLPLAIVAFAAALPRIDGGSTQTPPSRGPASMFVAVLLGAGCIAFAGWTGVLGADAVLIGLLLVASSPPACRWCMQRLPRRRRRWSRRRIEAALWDLGDGQPTLTSLSTADLCASWRGSIEALRSTRQPTDQARVVAVRQELLDELERRDPDGFRAWLASNASADGDPTRYVHETPRPPQSGADPRQS